MFCTNCGNKMNASSQFCTSCGHEKEKSTTPDGPPTKRKPLPKSILYGAVAVVVLITAIAFIGLGRPRPPDSALSFVPGLTHDYSMSLIDRSVSRRTAEYTYRVSYRNRLNLDNWFWQMTDGEVVLTLEWDSGNSRWTYSGAEWIRREYTDRTAEQLEGRWFVSAGFGASFDITISNVTQTSATVEWEHVNDGGRLARINGELYGTADVAIRLVEGNGMRHYVIDGIVLDRAILNNLWQVVRQDRYYFRVTRTQFDICMNPSVPTTGDIRIRRRQN